MASRFFYELNCITGFLELQLTKASGRLRAVGGKIFRPHMRMATA
jgi:hypothetical protein